MKFTILIAAYNASSYINQCLDSIFAQTEKSVQVIIIDDCSTDDSLQIEQQYTKVRDNCVLVLHTPQNAGQAEARNLGLHYAVGELTMMVDADDWLAPDCLERIWEAYKREEDIDAVCMRLMLRMDDGSEREWNDISALPEMMTGREACRLTIIRRLHGLYAVRTEMHKIMPFDTTSRLYSDDNTTYIHFLHSRKVVQSGGIYYYRQHELSSTHQAGIQRLMFLRANQSLRLQLEAHGADGELLALCEEHCYNNFVGIYGLMQKLLRTDTLTEKQEEEVRTTLEECYETLRFDRLGRYRLSYRNFCRWQKVKEGIKKFIGRA